MKNFLMLLISVFFFACLQKENRNTSPEGSKPILANKDKEENKQTGDTIYMNATDKNGVFTAEGVLDSIHPKIYVKFRNENLGELKAVILPVGGKGNIRFNQIIFPDKTSDGPFGMDLKIQLTQKGDHIIVIGHSLMADNPFWGKFKVQFENKKD
ncbi:hypothetical protein [Flavobacterium chilense]|uniref:Lipoprotein n=1 Tax=Flavobacterium chilense TaxID=946677 RepID=A0A1M7MPN3_9FLAO|nr:hypothetical protein [Flavobacterium chilense]SHM92973.1 hypothetical protein SAMN05444484_11366 [Flavobacterium chilense]